MDRSPPRKSPDTTEPPGTTAPPLRRTSAAWLALELAGVTAFFVLLSVATGEPATACGWCAANPFDAACRALLLAHDRRGAAALSHALSVGAAPALAFGYTLVAAARTRRYARALQDGAVIVNAFLLVTALADGVKKLADRQRPAFHYGVADRTEAAAAPVEAFLSFFSGDTAWAFVLGATVATLAFLRGERAAPWLALTAALVGVSTAALRVAADMHWVTDVLAGAAVGTGIGIALPALVHGPAQARAPRRGEPMRPS